MRTEDIKHANGRFWVGDTHAAYAVFLGGPTRAATVSPHPHTPAGLADAIARCDQLANQQEKHKRKR